MEDFVKLTIALTFGEETNSWLTKLAKSTAKNQRIIYRTGKESIPHLTVVQGKFELKSQNGKSAKDAAKSIEEAIRAERLSSTVPDLQISSKSTWTSTSSSGVFTGLYVVNDTMLQRLNNRCVGIIRDLGGDVTSPHGIKYFPHLTLALLQPGQRPKEIFSDVKHEKVLHSPNLVVGKNGTGGSLVEVCSEPIVTNRVRGSLRRNLDLGRR